MIGVKSIADDILVFGKSIDEHNANLEALLIRLLEAGLTINRKECVIGVKEVSFFGHWVSAACIRPMIKETLREIQRPQTKSEVRSYMGIVNFIGKYIPGCCCTGLWYSIERAVTSDNPADYFSRKPVSECSGEEETLASETECFVNSVLVDSTPNPINLQEIIAENSGNLRDPVMIKLRECINSNKWPKQGITGYKQVKSELMCKNGIVLSSQRMVLPPVFLCFQKECGYIFFGF